MTTAGSGKLVLGVLLLSVALSGCFGYGGSRQESQHPFDECCHLAVTPREEWTGPSWALEDIPRQLRIPEVQMLVEASFASAEQEAVAVSHERCSEVGGNLTRAWFEEGYGWEWKGPMVRYQATVFLIGCEPGIAKDGAEGA